MSSTLVWSTCNPEGHGDDYHGWQLRADEIPTITEQVRAANGRGERIPVLLEHKGVSVGHVVSAWEHGGHMQCVLAIDNRVFEGALGAEFVRSGIVRDVSLGYSMDYTCSRTGVRAANKMLKEISLVKRGLRPKCHIHGTTG